MRICVIVGELICMGLQPTGELNAGAAVKDGPFHPAFGKLAAAFGLSSIEVRQDAHLPPDTVLVDGDVCPFPT